MAIVATKITATGYGEIELNQVAFRRDGRIEAQAKLASNLGTNDPGYVENGMMLALDPVKREVKYPAAKNDAALLNYTTEHMYDERLVGALKDFKLVKNSFLPRLGYLAKGDKFTTNTITMPIDTATPAADHSYASETAFKAAMASTALQTTPAYGHTYTDGRIYVDDVADGAFAQVVKATTMPDGNFALQFIAL